MKTKKTYCMFKKKRKDKKNNKKKTLNKETLKNKK